MIWCVAVAPLAANPMYSASTDGQYCVKVELIVPCAMTAESSVVVALPVGIGATQIPDTQLAPPAQVPHEPPQPSSPQTCEPHEGAHAHVPAAVHTVPLAHVPHEPPQPSLPQTTPVQFGTH